MTDEGPAPDEAGRTRGRERQKKRRASRASFFSVLGEVLITGGVVVLLFIGWQLWWNDWITASQQSAAASDLSRQWIEQAKTSKTPTPTASATPAPTATPTAAGQDFGQPAVLPASSITAGKAFGVLYVPRFGDTYQRNIAQGTGTDVLNSTKLGIGHYPDTQLPGEIGNFAIASHRSAYGGGMHVLNEFQLGDPIIVQTADGWYTYRFRNLQYVHPSQVEVLYPVPTQEAVAPTDRIITLTTCNPLLSTAERIIAYGVFDSWRPTSAGPPPEIAAQIAAQNGAN